MMIITIKIDTSSSRRPNYCDALHAIFSPLHGIQICTHIYLSFAYNFLYIPRLAEQCLLKRAGFQSMCTKWHTKKTCCSERSSSFDNHTFLAWLPITTVKPWSMTFCPCEESSGSLGTLGFCLYKASFVPSTKQHKMSKALTKKSSIASCVAQNALQNTILGIRCVPARVFFCST